MIRPRNSISDHKIHLIRNLIARRCKAMRGRGLHQCQLSAREGSEYCGVHGRKVRR